MTNANRPAYLVGDIVMLICRDDDNLQWPPFGAVGEIKVSRDRDGDYGVMFPDYPCPVESPEWYMPQSYLIPVGKQQAIAELADLRTSRQIQQVNCK